MAEDPLTTHARTRVGRVLRNKWTLDRIIGVGGMAAVYEATHRNGSKVAIKMLHPTLMYDTNFAHALIQEGYVANKINHPAAVKVFDDDADETDGTVFLVMELLEGMTISQARRKRKKFPAVEAFKMLDPVLECLGNAHERGIVHRDIKPENLWVSTDGSVRVLDFGIARMTDNSNVAATRAGMVVGSPAYMSPEQALGKMNSVGPQTDVYAVGATLFALISGTTPHAGESTQEMIVMVATQSARAITTVMPDMHPAAARVIDKALAYDKDKRYADARAMLDDLRAAIGEIEGVAPRVLPTFADEEEEGETTVSAALKGPGSDSKPKAAPLPAAGLNRIGVRPQTGRFTPVTAPPAAPAPIAEAMAPVNPAPDVAPKMRPPTLAPVGAPGAAQGIQPFGVAPGQASGPYPSPGVASGPHSVPGQGSGAHAAAFSPDAMAPGAFDAQVSTGLPPTMAIPVMSPLDFSNPGATSVPGGTSGQRPGATTNMAWASPPATTEEAPPPRKPRTMLYAAAAGALLLVGGIAAVALSGGGSAPNPPVVARPTRPAPVVRPPVQTPPPNVVAANPAADAGEAVAAPPQVAQANAPVEADAGAAPSQPPTEPHVAQADPPAHDDNNTRSAHRHGHAHDTGAQAATPHEAPVVQRPTAQPSGNTHRPGRNRPPRGGDPLGY